MEGEGAGIALVDSGNLSKKAISIAAGESHTLALTGNQERLEGFSFLSFFQLNFWNFGLFFF